MDTPVGKLLDKAKASAVRHEKAKAAARAVAAQVAAQMGIPGSYPGEAGEQPGTAAGGPR